MVALPQYHEVHLVSHVVYEVSDFEESWVEPLNLFKANHQLRFGEQSDFASEHGLVSLVPDLEFLSLDEVVLVLLFPFGDVIRLPTYPVRENDRNQVSGYHSNKHLEELGLE